MNAELGALPVQARELEENYKQVESFQQARARSARRMTKLAVAVAAGLGLANIGLAWAVASMLPLTRLGAGLSAGPAGRDYRLFAVAFRASGNPGPSRDPGRALAVCPAARGL